jgi:hypothetical protein
MPNICFSYSSDVPLGIRNRGAAPLADREIQRMQMLTPCFSYQPAHGVRNASRAQGGKCVTTEVVTAESLAS